MDSTPAGVADAKSASISAPESPNIASPSSEAQSSPKKSLISSKSSASQPPAESKEPEGWEGILEKTQGKIGDVMQWASEHPAQAYLVGAGATLGAALAYWAIYRAIKNRKSKEDKNETEASRRRRRHPRDFSPDKTKRANTDETGAALDEIDWNDNDFLEFLAGSVPELAEASLDVPADI